MRRKDVLRLVVVIKVERILLFLLLLRRSTEVLVELVKVVESWVEGSRVHGGGR